MKDRKIYAYVVRTYQAADNGETLAVIGCPFCGTEHHHGKNEGWRTPHCKNRECGDEVYHIRYKPIRVYGRREFKD
jgi:hypothetical protein